MSRLSSRRLLSHTSKPSLRLEPRSCRHLQTYYTSSRAQSHLLAQQHQFLPRQYSIQKRTFLSNFIPSPPKPSSNSNSNNDPNNNGNGRILTATRTLPFTSEPLFAVISSVESYSQFLPFLTASTVTARDEKTGLPSQAFLTVGYGPLSETFTSKVECKPEEGVVEARSDEGIFEYLSTRWELVPEAAGEGGEPRTTVKLEIRFEFKSQLYASMMSAVEGQMAGIMIEAFEKRVREINGR
ncbi:dehydrase and lipid transport-domain-containing protein [Aspergillus filifer]